MKLANSVIAMVRDIIIGQAKLFVVAIICLCMVFFGAAAPMNKDWSIGPKAVYASDSDGDDDGGDSDGDDDDDDDNDDDNDDDGKQDIDEVGNSGHKGGTQTQNSSSSSKQDLQELGSFKNLSEISEQDEDGLIGNWK